MPVGTQLSVLRTNLKTVLGATTNSAVGVDENPALNYLLRSTQNILWAQHEWPHLRLFKTITLAAGQRYYDMPTGINFDRVIKAAVYFGQRPLPIDRGIDFPQYAQFNSDLGLRADPVRRWDLVRVNPTRTQVEVWPIPASSGNTVQFHSMANLNPLLADIDTCDLDDDLLVFESAVDRLFDDESPKAARVRDKAQRLRGYLMTNSQGRVTADRNDGGFSRGATVVVSR